jgi:hypothetical protein
MYDGDGGKFWRETKRRARKDHRCTECRRRIQSGEEYWSSFGVHEYGGAYTGKTCAHCHVAQEWLMKQCDGFIYEMVREDIEEHVLEFGLVSTYSLARLAVGMRRRWTRRDGTLMEIPEVPPLAA